MDTLSRGRLPALCTRGAPSRFHAAVVPPCRCKSGRVDLKFELLWCFGDIIEMASSCWYRSGCRLLLDRYGAVEQVGVAAHHVIAAAILCRDDQSCRVSLPL